MSAAKSHQHRQSQWQGTFLINSNNFLIFVARILNGMSKLLQNDPCIFWTYSLCLETELISDFHEC